MGPAMPMGLLASLLSRVSGYQVVDHTGLTGSYDVNLRFRPEGTEGSTADLLTAIQEQLGLKLEPGKGAVETIVVDRAERTPVE